MAAVAADPSDLGVFGLAVMGENLVLNFESRGYRVSVYNRSAEVTHKFVSGRGAGKKIVGFAALPEFVASLAKPRRVMLMVKAGQVVDACIQHLVPLLEQGDIIIDGGNSHYMDSDRRTRELAQQGILFIGTGVSGGEEGALTGPSVMPGGNVEAWPAVRDMLQAISAKVAGGSPCCDWVGQGGAGHFVKMVHNGIEYGDIQLICEAYHFMKTVLRLSNDRMAEVFAEWDRGDLNSYLIQITADILRYRDEEQKEVSKVDLILDTAGQKGTGKWTVMAALETGTPVTLISEAVLSRCLSAQKEERMVAAELLAGPEDEDLPPAEFSAEEQAAMLENLRDALFASKVVSYAQGFALIRGANAEYGWQVDMGAVALMWRGGCIIRSSFLSNIKAAFDKDADLGNLLLDEWFRGKMAAAQKGWRRVAAHAIQFGLPCPAITSALAYYDGYRSAQLPANLLQAQRDYFGAHTYERVDHPRGRFFHTNWTGRGGETVSTTYQV